MKKLVDNYLASYSSVHLGLTGPPALCTIVWYSAHPEMSRHDLSVLIDLLGISSFSKDIINPVVKTRYDIVDTSNHFF